MSKKDIEKINEIIDHLLNEFEVQSILCFGSYAISQQDEKSDVDLLVILKSSDIPTEDIRRAAYIKMPQLKLISLSRDLSNWDISWSPINDEVEFRGQKIEVGFNKASWVNTVVNNLIVKNKITFNEFPFRPYTFLGLLESSLCLYDKDNFIENIKLQIRPYPKGLKKEIIRSFLHEYQEDYKDLLDYSERRIGILAYEFVLFRAIDAAIQLLYVINDIYDPASKNTEYFLFRLKKQPHGLSEFINKILPRFWDNKKEVLEYLGKLKVFLQDQVL